ncbi:AmmeMemoRadiSam system radical SAM enzyme [Nanoarchaeota archaeon]
MGGKKTSSRSTKHKSHSKSKTKSRNKAKPAGSPLQKRLTRRDFIKRAAIATAGIGIAAYAANRLLFNKGSHTLRAESHIFPDSAPAEPWKWSKEAYHYLKSGKDVNCLLCPHGCRLSPGDRGVCRARVNIDGKLYSLVYGNPCAVHVDPMEKKPLFHFLPATRIFSIATAGCNLRCLNCQNWQISQSRPEDTNNTEMFPEQVVANAIKTGSKSVAYTYSEPSIFYEYMYDTAKLAHEKGLRNVWVTSGHMNPEPLTQLSEYMDAANIDLKGFDNSIYMQLNGARLKPILNTIKLAVEKNIWTELTWLAVPTWTDNLDTIRDGMEWLYKNIGPDYPVHFSRFHPLHKLTSLPSTPVATLEKARKTAMDAGMKYVYIGNVPGNSAQHTHCPRCGKIVIKRRGYSVDMSNFESGACKACGESIKGVWK